MWIKNNILANRIIFTLLSLFAMGFMLQGSLLISISFAVLVFLEGCKLYTYKNRTFPFLIVLSLIFIAHTGREGIIIIGCPMAYYIGMRVNTDEKGYIKLYLVLAFSMCFHVFLNFVYEYTKFGSAVFTSALHYDVWSQAISATTAIMANATLFAAVSYFCLFATKNKMIRLVAIVTMAFLGVYDIAMGGRSFLYLTAIALVLGFIVNIYLSGFSKDLAKLLGKVFIVVVVLYILVRLVFLSYSGEIKAFFNNSYFYHRFFGESASDGMLESPRWVRKVEYLKLLFDYPFGGGHIFEAVGGSSHELWLDIGDKGGIISYTLFLFYSISSVIRATKLLKHDAMSNEVKILYFSAIIVLNIQFFLEPIITGSPILLMIYCMIDGCIWRMLYKRPLYIEETI